jgi:protein SCO1/2
MKPEIRKRLARTALFAGIAFVVGASMGLFQVKDNAVQTAQTSSKITPMAGVQVGGPFALINHYGAAVTEEDYAGYYKLIYFGFTYCPAICPTELQKISKVMNKLGDDAIKVQPIFITIDPDRDTVEVLRDYVSLFHPDMVGLTGPRESIDAVLKNYRVFATKVETEEGNDYTMDHSSFIYLMSPDDELISMYRIKDDVDYIVKDVQARLNKSEI